MDKASKSPTKNLATEILRRDFPGGSVVQTPTEDGLRSIPDQGTRSHILQLSSTPQPKILHVPVKIEDPTRCSQDLVQPNQ